MKQQDTSNLHLYVVASGSVIDRLGLIMKSLLKQGFSLSELNFKNSYKTTKMFTCVLAAGFEPHTFWSLACTSTIWSTEESSKVTILTTQ